MDTPLKARELLVDRKHMKFALDDGIGA
ncbi:MAG: hypothetical protein FD160_4011, partial [Caulobacteraceae bacterium]